MPHCIHGMDCRFCSLCLHPGRAESTRRQDIEKRAQQHKPSNDAERESFEAVYAYEEVLSGEKGQRTRAGRTWPMIAEHGVIAAFERIVTRRKETSGCRILVEMGLDDMPFEAVVLRHPDSFSPAAVAASAERLQRLKDAAD